ncbi:MAG: PQQ-binding-like beta-propeller repeat protein [Phycisphaerae bacterium]|nr:PQQ-binding-like beta-propeller repeat protein [Phycisphaerae bacterium]
MTRNLHCSCLIVCLLFGVLPAARADWPQFRGPWGTGHVSAPGDTRKIGIPLRWSETENVKWKTAIPHRGWSTPVVMAGKVWLTTATLDGREFFVVCVDTDSGRIRLYKKLFGSDNPEPLGNNVNCYASPSPTIEPGRVYIHFGSYGTACLDTATGNVLWQRSDLPCRHYRGPGSSLILFEDLLILSMDGVDVQYIVALDKKSGRTVWKTDRTADWNDLDSDGKPKREGDLRKSYYTPLIIDVNGKTQMLSAGAKAAYSYDPLTGAELWKINYTCYSGASSPLFGHGLAYINTGFPRPELWAVRVDGEADVTDTHVVWKRRQAVPQIPSPLLIDDLLFMLSDTGAVTCLDAVAGGEIWREHLRGRFAASLLYADGRIYCFSQDGRTTVLKAARKYELLATNTLESGFMASAAVAGKALFLRTKTHLYRIETP